jgi:hypothetical protein
MASAAEYAAWIVANKDKKGTKEFETVSKAYQLAKQSAPATPSAPTQPGAAIPNMRATGQTPAETQPPAWMDVALQAFPRAAAGTIDATVNAIPNAIKLAKMGYGVAVNELGLPTEYMPEVTAPSTPAYDFLTNLGVIQEMPNMTPAQRITSAALEGASGVLMGGGPGGAGKALANQLFKDTVTSGGAAAAGQAVTEATGNEYLGLATSVAAPVAASRVPALNAPRLEAQFKAQEYNKTLNDAKEIGFLVMPEGAAARFAGQDSMLKVIEDTNQDVVNKVARDSLPGFKPDKSLSADNLIGYRNSEYNRGYAPFKSMRLIRPDQQYISELTTIAANPSYDTKKIEDMIKKLHTRGGTQLGTTTFDPDYVMSRVSALRSDASRNRKNTENADTYNLGAAQKKLADALEGLTERQLVRDYSTTPQGAQKAQQIIDRFRQSRKNIAVSHVIEDSLLKGSEKVQLDELARAIQRGDYITGDLEKAAKFGNVYKPAKENKKGLGRYSYAAGMTLGGAAAAKLGLDPSAGALVAGGALLAAQTAANPLQKATQAYLLSGGQPSAGIPDYTAMGINPRMAFPAAVGAFSNIPPEEEQQ